MTIEELEKIERTPIMFIMGKGRSGTTLLQAILNAHPNIVAPTESRIIIFMYAKYGHVKQWTEQLLEKFCNELYDETRFLQNWNIDKNKLLPDLLSVKDRLNYALICKIIYCRTDSASKDIRLIFDKNPVYYFFIRELQQIFPEAKYIHIVRDYRDNIISHQRVLPFSNTADVAYRWLKINKYLEEQKVKNPEEWFTIKYESLATEPIKCMAEVFKFVGMPFYENVVSDFSSKLSPMFYENANKKEFNKFHWNVFNPVNTSQIGQWKTTMPINDIEIAESIDGSYAKQMYGYEISVPAKRLNSIILLKAKILYAFNRTFLRTVLKQQLLYKSFRFLAKAFMRKSKLAGR
jgi:hypothetical protein